MSPITKKVKRFVIGDLSKDFSSREFRCPCGCGLDEVSVDLIQALQELRNQVGVPIYVTTISGNAGGVRCAARNKQAGGAEDSRHLIGEAADIVIRGYSVKKMYWAALRVERFLLGGIGVYPDNGFIHGIRRHSGIP